MAAIARTRLQQAGYLLPLIDEDAMDLNQLYFDHQITVMRAGAAQSDALRRDRQFDASLIAGRIGCIQRALGAKAARAWETLSAPDASELTSRSLALQAPAWRDDLAPAAE